MAGTAEKENKSKKNRVLLIILILFAIIVVALLAVIVFLLTRKPEVADNPEVQPGREVSESVRTVVDESEAEDIMAQMREEVAEGMFECKMSMEWSFKDGASESKDAYVANSANNTHPIYFDVILDESGEVIYSSPVLPVGTDLTNIKLDKELPAGEYTATVMYTLIKDVETQEEISTAGFVVTIKILN